jgi:phage terminase large subunit
MLPEANQARKAIWDAVNPHTGQRRIDEAFPKQLRANTRNDTMSIVFKNGAHWQVVGSDNYNSLVGSPPAGCVFSEWALNDPKAWAYLRPILVENGGWALFPYTPRGINHGKTSYEAWEHDPEWYCEKLTCEQTDVFTPEQIQQERKEYISVHGDEEGRALFEQEYYCSFEAPVIGAYYGSQMVKADEEGRICSVPHDPNVGVETWWDLGIGDSTAIWWVQRVGQEIHVIDHHEENGKALPHYVGVLEDKRREYGFNYVQHVLPHDAKARELQTGKTREEALKNLGLEITIIPQHNVDDGIHAVRMLLARCWFDQNKCQRGLDALKSYRKAEDEHRSDGVHKFYQSKPRHDWSSHSADAFRYGAMAKSRTTGNRARGAIEYPSMKEMGMI